MVVGVSTTAGVGVTSLFAMESSPYAPAVVTDIFNEKGGKAGIWQSGMAPATDGSRLFVVTGNGQGHENKDTPASGRAPLSTLDEVIANLGIRDGKLQLDDYFEPYEYIGMDAGDRDLGSGGVALLDPSVFKGKNGVARLGVTIGKNGKVSLAPGPRVSDPISPTPGVHRQRRQPRRLQAGTGWHRQHRPDHHFPQRRLRWRGLLSARRGVHLLHPRRAAHAGVQTRVRWKRESGLQQSGTEQ